MKIDNSGNFTRELRQLAGDVETRRSLEESAFDRKRLSDLGELLLIAADMAAQIEGVPMIERDMPVEVANELFESILYREWPDQIGPGANG
jgi:hypothetical protein